MHAIADTDEKEAALQAAQLEELLRCAFGEDSQERVLTYEACELDGDLNGTLYAVCRADGIQTLHIVRREDGVIVSHLVSDSSLLRKDTVPILYVETEGRTEHHLSRRRSGQHGACQGCGRRLDGGGAPD